MPLAGEGKQCEAKSKRSGEQCQKWAMQGKNVCHIHGGKSRSGTATKSFKHGRYSKHMPKRLLDRYHESLEDNDALAQAEEVAVLDAMIKDQMRQMKESQRDHIPTNTAAELKNAWRQYKRSRELEEWGQARASLAEIDRLMKLIGDAGRSEEQLTKRISQKTRLVESERRRMVENKQMMTIDEVMTITTAMTEVFVRALKKLPPEFAEDMVGDVSTDIGRLINARTTVRPVGDPTRN